MKDIYISKDRKSSDDFDVVYLDDTAPLPPLEEPPQEPQFEPEQPEKPQKVKKTKKHKKHRFLRFVAAFIAVIIVLTSSFIYLFAAASGYNKEDLEANQYISSSELTSSPMVTNILLMGVDGSSKTSQRSDSMILVSIDMAHRKIKLTSFLRDSWVTIPSKDKMAKLNAAYSYGGAQLAVDTLEYNFGVDIDHFAAVDFDMFTQIIDKLGGVDVEVTEKEAKFINRTTRYTVESGESVHLDGAKALVYCRIRKLDTDYMRTYRQRKVITALINKAKRTPLTKLIAIMRDIFPLITTDLSPLEITGLAYKGGMSMLLFDIEQTRVPLEDQCEAGMHNGQWTEVLDFDAVRRFLHDFIYTDKIDVSDK